MIEIQEDKKFYYQFRIVMKVILVIIAIASIFSGINFLIYNHDHPNNSYEWDVNQPMPEEAQVKINMLNDIRKLLGVGVLFMFVHVVFDYKLNPKTHWFNKVKGIIVDVGNEINKEGTK